MHVTFLYNEAAEDPANIAEDDPPANSPEVAALVRLGHEVTSIACTLDLAAVRRRLDRLKPDVAFNRVESLGGSDALAAAITLLLDAMQIPYTGCPTNALVSTASKLAVKERLVRAGLPTPRWISEDFRLRTQEISDSSFLAPRSSLLSKFILKSVFEHASFEMDDDAVIEPCSPSEIARVVHERSTLAGRPFFAEKFIEGREFNLSLLGEEPQVLPPAEIDFSAFTPNKPRIVGYGAKWDATSFEFQNTPRRFDFPAADAPLVRRLSELAVECWRLFDLSGYARIDFRCDAAGEPWILEVNANPCISPAAGYAAALDQAGLSYDDAIQRILDIALPPSARSATPPATHQPLPIC
ncbi:MAG: hypothetical protein WD738_19975 [Pirellulales bacterium]